MTRHLLVTVSDDPSALAGIRFVGSFFRHKDNMRLTLFFTATSPQFHNTPREGSFLAEQRRTQREESGIRALEQAGDILMGHGFERPQVDTKLKSGCGSKVSDIILEADKELYDAVVLGRRGVSWLEEALGQSVTRDLFEKPLSFPFWVCREPEVERKNVLLCVDGSAPSLRMADHVGFMLEEHPEHSITLFTVEKKVREDVGVIFDECLDTLADNNIPKSRVKTVVSREHNVANAILGIARQERFGVVAMGRTGTGGGIMDKLFLGSASSVLFHQLRGAVLWVSH